VRLKVAKFRNSLVCATWHSLNVILPDSLSAVRWKIGNHYTACFFHKLSLSLSCSVPPINNRAETFVICWYTSVSKISIFVQNLMLQYKLQRGSLLVFDTRLLSPAHYFKSNYFKMNFIVFLTFGSPTGLVSSGFPKGTLCVPFVFPTSAVTFHPSHHSWFNHYPTNLIWRASIKLVSVYSDLPHSFASSDNPVQCLVLKQIENKLFSL
jgi:hypothetical protein